MDRKQVARHYCKTWLALDVVASFPLDLIFAGKRLDMWRLPRLLKIIRVMNYKSLTHACAPGHDVQNVHPALLPAWQMCNCRAWAMTCFSCDRCRRASAGWPAAISIRPAD